MSQGTAYGEISYIPRVEIKHPRMHPLRSIARYASEWAWSHIIEEPFPEWVGENGHSHLKHISGCVLVHNEWNLVWTLKHPDGRFVELPWRYRFEFIHTWRVAHALIRNGWPT